MGKQVKKAPPGRFKTSPVTAEAKRGPSLGYTSPNQVAKAQGIHQANIKTSPDNIVESPFANDYFNPKFLGFELGDVDDSAFSPLNFNDPFNSNIDFEKIRADKQSTISKLGSTGVQFLGKTSVGIVGNIIGGFYGLFKSLGEEGKDAIFDNSVYRTLDEWNEAIEAKNSVFLNRKKGLGMNFELFKDVTDAFSFITSAVASEMIMQTAGNIVGGAGVASLPGRMGRYLRGVGQLSKQLDNAQDLEALALKLGTTVDKMSRHKRNLDLIKGVAEIPRKILTTTGYEASLEARQTSDDFMVQMEDKVDTFLRRDQKMSDDEKAEYKADWMNKAQKAASKAGMMTFGLNTAVLSASNIMQFPTLFGSSYLKAKRLHTLERGALGKVQQAKGGSKFVKGISKVGAVLKNPITEFTEETLQKVASEGSKHYYESILDTQTSGETLLPAVQNFADSMWQGMKDTYGSDEGIHEGIIGAIVGAIGLPGFKKVAGKNKLNWQGGIPGSIKDIRKKKHYTESAIDALNSIKMSDAMNYNKDNAILATVDADREDLSIIKGDPIEFEAVQDNKVFRYVTDRMKKGVEEFINEDVQELQQMDLETYKKTFGKEDSFTQEDKDKAVKDFSTKVDIYKQAFKVAHKTLDFGSYHYDNLVQNKLSDILTHSLATEKVYGERLEALKQTLYELNTSEFTREEIDGFVETSGKVKAAQQAIDEYVKQRTKEQSKPLKTAKEKNSAADVQAELKSQLDPVYAYLLDVDSNTLQEQKDILLQVENPSKELTNQLNNIDKALGLKEQYELTKVKGFNAKKSSIVRDKEKSLQELANEINSKIEAEASAAMKELGAMPKKVTSQELGEYLTLKTKIADEINKKNDSSYTIDKPITESDDRNLLEEIGDITHRFTTATQVAASLYGIRRNPESMYSRLVASELFANIDNTRRKALELEFLRMNNAPLDLMSSRIDDLEADLKTLKEQYATAKNYLTPKSNETVKDVIKFIEEVLENFEDYIEKTKAVEKQDSDAKATIDEGPTLKEQLAAEGLLAEEEDAPTEQGDTKRTRTIDKKFNRLTINESREDGTDQLSNPGFPTLKEAIADGVIKDKAATTITYSEDESNPSDNSVLQNILEKEGVLEEYLKGKEKVENDPTLLEDMTADKDVFTFVRFSPILLNIYDKQANKVEGHYEYDISEEDNILFQQYLFTADNIFESGQDTVDNQEAFEAAVKELKAWQKEEKENKKGKGKQAKTTNANIKAEYNRRYKELEDTYLSPIRGSHSNLQMRKDLLINYYNGNNELKLKVHNVDQGNFENFKGGTKIINENPVEELGYDAATIDMNNIMYTNQKGEYVRVDGTEVNIISNHPMQNMTAGQSSSMYFNYENKAGKNLPIKMNLAKLRPSDINLIFSVFEDYLTRIDKSNFIVEVDKSQHRLLSEVKGMNMKKFLSFFLKIKKNKADSPLFVKNTFNLNTTGLPNNQMSFSVLNGGVKNMELIFPPATGTNSDEILAIFRERKEELREILLSQRHNFNKDFFISNKELNRDALDYMFSEGIINHAFNVNENFDKIYDPNYNKKVVISKADIDDQASEQIKSQTFAQAIKEFRGIITNKEGEYEGNLTDLYNSIERGIKASVTVKLGYRDDNLSSKEKNELLTDSINSVIDKRIALVEEMGNRFPGQLTITKDHEADTKINASDKPMDQVLKWLYHFKNVALGKEYKKQLSNRMDHWNAMSRFMEAFRHPPGGSTFAMMNFVDNSDGTEVENHIASSDHLDSMMRIINVLDELTQGKGRYVDVNYSETYPKAKTKFNRKFKSSKGLKPSQLTNVHHKTRLRSVQIEEQPIWKDGELVAGEIYFNFGTKDKSGKLGNQKVLVLSANKALETSTNIMTSISLPFISPSTGAISPQFDDMLNDISDSIGEDISSKIIALSKFKQAKQVGKGTASDWVIDEDAIEEETAEDIAASVAEEARKAGVVIEEETPKNPFEQKKTLTTLSLNSDVSKKIFLTKIVTAYAPSFASKGSLTDKRKDSALKDLKSMGVNNLTDYLFALDYYNKQELAEYNETNIAFGEKIFGEKRDDCK